MLRNGLCGVVIGTTCSRVPAAVSGEQTWLPVRGRCGRSFAAQHSGRSLVPAAGGPTQCTIEIPHMPLVLYRWYCIVELNACAEAEPNALDDTPDQLELSHQLHSDTE